MCVFFFEMLKPSRIRRWGMKKNYAMRSDSEKKMYEWNPKNKELFLAVLLVAVRESLNDDTTKGKRTLLRDYITVHVHDFESDICTTRKSYVRLVGNSKILIRINLLSFIRRERSFRVNKTNTSQTVVERNRASESVRMCVKQATWWRWPCGWSRKRADKLPGREKITSKFQLQ